MLSIIAASAGFAGNAPVVARPAASVSSPVVMSEGIGRRAMLASVLAAVPLSANAMIVSHMHL